MAAPGCDGPSLSTPSGGGLGPGGGTLLVPLEVRFGHAWGNPAMPVYGGGGLNHGWAEPTSPSQHWVASVQPLGAAWA